MILQLNRRVFKKDNAFDTNIMSGCGFMCFLLDLMLMQFSLAGKVCVYSYDSDYRQRLAYVYCVTDCCGTVGGFICCVKGSYYKYLNYANGQRSDPPLSSEAIAAITVGSVIGLIVFICIFAVLYIAYTKGLIWFQGNTFEDTTEEELQPAVEINYEIETTKTHNRLNADIEKLCKKEKKEKHFLETHFL